MKHFALLIAAALLVLAPQALRAYEYKDEAIRVTIPDDFSCEPFSDGKVSGFTAVKGALKLSMFVIPGQNIGRRNNLGQEDSKWFPSLEGREICAQRRPLWRRYDQFTDYPGKDGKGYVRVYRYISASNLCFLIAESNSNQWEEADQIAQSQRFQKSVGFYWANFGNWLVSFIIWLSSLVGLIIICVNTAKYYRDKRYWCYGIVIAAIGGGLAFTGWQFHATDWLLLTNYALTIFSAVYDDDSSGGNSESKDNDGPDFTDATGTTIHYDF